MIRHPGTYDAKSRPRSRAVVAPVPNPRLPDLQAFLARAYLLEKTRQPQAGADTAEWARLLSCLVALQRQVADPELNLDQVLASLAGDARIFANADAAAIALLHDDDAVCRARAGFKAPCLGTSIDLTSSFTGQAFRTREVLHCEDSENDPRVNPGVCRAAGIRSILVAPVELYRTCIGIVEVLSASPGRFGAAEIGAMELLAGLVADAVRLRDPAEPPRSREPVLATADPVLAVAEPAPAVAEPVAATAEPVLATAEPAPAAPPVRAEAASSPEPAVKQEEPALTPSPPRKLFRPWLLASTLSLSCLTVIFVGHQHGIPKPAPQPRSVVNADLPSSMTVTVSALSQTVATGPAVLQGVAFNSQRDFTSVAIDLSGPVAITAEHLTNPERIYFDLAETTIAESVIDSQHIKLIPVNDRVISRVRVGQRSKDVARVVIDLNCSCDYMYVMSEAPPFRLVVEVHVPPLPSGARMAAASPAPEVLPPARLSASPLRPLKIVIDPGHGGSDTGTIGPSGLQEKELVLDVAERLSRLLKTRLGAQTMLTRSDDTFVPLPSRSALANNVGADLFVSIHANSSSARSVRGVETFYVEPTAYRGSTSGSPPLAVSASRRFAAMVQHALFATLSHADPMLQDRGVKAAPLSVLAAPTMPSVLTEISFVSSSYDEQKLRRAEYRDTIAEALFQGIKTYAVRDQRLDQPSNASAAGK
jgi:N-acetylmuramoyl-L-alanine amidase/putative methionine-R-sulfoxide reductase with GAF domain